MLTSDLAISWRRGGTTGPRYVDASDPNHLSVAADLVDIVRDHRERRFTELDDALQDYVGYGTDYKVLRGFIKLLMDRCTFRTSSPVEPSDLRRAVFLRAREHHPVVDGERYALSLAEAAATLGCAPEAAAENLYGDLEQNRRLADFEELDARELLDAYNLAQAQALLYRAVEMRLLVAPRDPAGYRQVLGAVKAYRLVHEIRGNASEGYEIRLDGPVSMFHRSQKYGVQMAVFLPALLECEGWRMRAEIDFKQGGSAVFELDSTQTRLRAGEAPGGRDQSAVVDKFLKAWDPEREGATAEPSREIVDLGETAFVPDVVIRAPGRPDVHLEVLGFWTPRYLADRLKEFERGRFRRFVLAASEELFASRDAIPVLPPNVVLFKSSLDPKAVRAAVERLDPE